MAHLVKSSFPWLLYSYPWMPFPRRVGIYLREKGIPEHLVKVVHVLGPNSSDGNGVVESHLFPPKPAGSLPILAIPPARDETNTDKNDYGNTAHHSEEGRTTMDATCASWIYIRQSTAIITFLEELCNTNQLGFSAPHGSMLGEDLFERTRNAEVLSLAEELTAGWNPVRMFGTKAGTMAFPEGAKEMLRWERRPLMAIETWWRDRDMSALRKGSEGHVTIADVVLYQFLEFTKDCYGVDMTLGSGEMVTDVYGRRIEEKLPKVKEFYETFKTRESARRVAENGEEPPESALQWMSTWHEGVL